MPEHVWTPFEKHTLYCLLAKGMHHQSKSKQSDGEEANMTNAYLIITTVLNKALYGENYDLDISRREVTRMIDAMLQEHKGVFGIGGFLERQHMPRMTKSLRMMCNRTPPIDHNGTLGEWNMGRKQRELARLPIMAYNNKVANWRAENPDADKNAHPFEPPSKLITPLRGTAFVAPRGDFYRPDNSSVITGRQGLTHNTQGYEIGIVGKYVDAQGHPVEKPSGASFKEMASAGMVQFIDKATGTSQSATTTQAVAENDDTLTSSKLKKPGLNNPILLDADSADRPALANITNVPTSDSIPDFYATSATPLPSASATSQYVPPGDPSSSKVAFGGQLEDNDDVNIEVCRED